MRKNISLLLSGLVVAGGLVFIPGCLKDHVTEKYTIYTPVVSLKSDVLAHINGSPAQTIAQTGQIYVKGSYIYLNDVDKGIHIIDNSDPVHPVQTAFLNIPGNENIGIRNNILYADMYADLLAIDISDVHQPKLVGTLRNFFSSRGVGMDSNYIVSSWNVKDTSFSVKPTGFLFQIPNTTVYGYTGSYPAAYASLSSSAAAKSNTGTAGSNAVMVLSGDYLYAIPEEHTLGIVNVTDSTKPNSIVRFGAGYDLETIFLLQDKLLLGSKEGVYVYSVAEPYTPKSLGSFTHGTACDPVIANSKYAYVTLHTGTYCGGSANELDILDAKDISNATLIKTYPMTKPSGLCVDGTILFVCDASVVKVYDVSAPDNIQLLSSIPVNNPNDVIAGNNLLLVVAADGLHEFDYTDPGSPKTLGVFAITNSKS